MSWLIVPPCPECGHQWRHHSHEHVGGRASAIECMETLISERFCGCRAQPELPIVPSYDTEDEMIDDLLRRFSVRTGRQVWPTPAKQFAWTRDGYDGVAYYDGLLTRTNGPSVVVVCLLCQEPGPHADDRRQMIQNRLFHARECAMKWWLAGAPAEWPPVCARCKRPEWNHPLPYVCAEFRLVCP